MPASILPTVAVPDRSGDVRDLARNRAAYQSSSVDFDHTAHLATDGWPDTRWMSAPTDGQWICVDLGASSALSEVALVWGDNHGAHYSVEVSEDNENWKTLFRTERGEGGIATIPAAGEKGRFVRMSCSRGSPTPGCSLVGFQVWGSGGMRIPEILQEGPDARGAPGGALSLRGGKWRLCRADRVKAGGGEISRPGFRADSWISATVPGTVLGSYILNGALPDPDYGAQNLMISEAFFLSDFWYRDEFEIPGFYSGRRVWLDFHGVNWKAEVYFNGIALGRIDGAFRRASFDASSLAMPGTTNALAVLVRKNDHPHRTTVKRLGDPGPNGGEMGLDSPTFLCSSGWNWLPSVRGRNIGIWDEVRLRPAGDVSLIDPFVTATLPLPRTDLADLVIQATLRNEADSATTCRLRGSVPSCNLFFEIEANLQAGESRAVRLDSSSHPQLRLRSPALWWPNGYGPQTLHELELSVMATCAGSGVALESDPVSDRKRVTFGIRQYGYDSPDENLAIRVNGKRVVVFGGNWGMDEAFKLVDPATYDAWVRMHAHMNLNMIRNWVGQTANPAFYEACDRHGIMVWNDFWLANPVDGPPPADENLFLDNVADTVKRLRNHACVALWCGRNEGYPPPGLDRGMRTLTGDLDGTRLYISHSGEAPVTGYPKNGGPYEIKDGRWYFANRGETMHSELGLVCPPSVESLRAFMDERDLWPICDTWATHDWTQERCELFLDTMRTDYGEPEGIEDFSRKASAILTLNIRAFFETWQSRRGGGVLMWMTHPSWPSFICQTYDYFLEPTAAYFAAKKACERVHLLWRPDDNRVQAANNLFDPLPGMLALAELRSTRGELLWSRGVKVDLPAGSTVDCFAIPPPTTSAELEFIRLSLVDARGVQVSENSYWRGRERENYRSLASLPAANVVATATEEKPAQSVPGGLWRVTATLTAGECGPVAFLLRLRLFAAGTGRRVLPSYWNDNFITLMPGETRSLAVDFGPPASGGEDVVVRVEGWNVAAFDIAPGRAGA